MGRRVDLIVGRNSKGGRTESAEVLKEKGSGREPAVGQIKAWTKDF